MEAKQVFFIRLVKSTFDGVHYDETSPTVQYLNVDGDVETRGVGNDEISGRLQQPESDKCRVPKVELPILEDVEDSRHHLRE